MCKKKQKLSVVVALNKNLNNKRITLKRNVTKALIVNYLNAKMQKEFVEYSVDPC